jgi:hypothetical protein
VKVNYFSSNGVYVAKFLFKSKKASFFEHGNERDVAVEVIFTVFWNVTPCSLVYVPRGRPQVSPKL